MGVGIVVPVLPMFAREFDVGVFAVSVLIAVYSGVRMASNIWAGWLSDRIGTRRAIAIGAVITAVASLATAAVGSYGQLLALRAVSGFGSAVFFTALLALVVQLAPVDQRSRAVGLLHGAFLLGIAAGPSVGGALAEPLGVRWPFVIYAGFCAAAALLALLRLRERTGAQDPQTAGALTIGQTLRAGQTLLTESAFVAAIVMMVVARWAVTTVRFTLAPFFALDVLGASTLAIGVGLTIAMVGHAAVLWPAARFSDTVGRRALGAPAYLGFAALTAVIGWTAGVPVFMIVMGLFGAGTGLTSLTPPAVVADVVPQRHTGVGVGLLNTAGDLGGVLGPLVSGGIAQMAGYSWGFGSCAALLALGGLVALRMSETRPTAVPAPLMPPARGATSG